MASFPQDNAKSDRSERRQDLRNQMSMMLAWLDEAADITDAAQIEKIVTTCELPEINVPLDSKDRIELLEMARDIKGNYGDYAQDSRQSDTAMIKQDIALCIKYAEVAQDVDELLDIVRKAGIRDTEDIVRLIGDAAGGSPEKTKKKLGKQAGKVEELAIKIHRTYENYIQDCGIGMDVPELLGEIIDSSINYYVQATIEYLNELGLNDDQILDLAQKQIYQNKANPDEAGLPGTAGIIFGWTEKQHGEATVCLGNLVYAAQNAAQEAKATNPKAFAVQTIEGALRDRKGKQADALEAAFEKMEPAEAFPGKKMRNNRKNRCGGKSP